MEPDRIAAEDTSPKSLRLLYLLSRYPAVSHTFFLNEIRELRKRGIAIDVASINETDRSWDLLPPEEAIEAKNAFYIKATGLFTALAVTCRTLLFRPRVFFRGLAASLKIGAGSPSATLKALCYFVEALVLGAWMTTRGHRHLHIHFCGPVASVGLLTSIAWGFSYSLAVHGPDEFFDVEKFYLRRKVESAKFIVCISSFCRSQLMRVVGPKHWGKMHVVPLGVDLNVFRRDPRENKQNESAEILCVGRLVPAKGQMILLRACAQLRDEGYSLRVRLVGDGPDRQHLESYAKEIDLPVFFEGARSHDETRRILAQADIFSLASFAEGVPVALMEAMAMEIPCVSTNIAGIPELIRDGLDGLLVPASSVEALAEALKRLIQDSGLRKSLGMAGWKRVGEFYNLQKNASLLAETIRANAPSHP